MIDYSVNPQINPLAPTADPKYYAKAQARKTLTIADFAKHITDHGTNFKRGDVIAILMMAVDCMREEMLEGNSVQLGELGKFYIVLNSKGQKTAEDFNPAQHILAVKTNWEPGTAFENLKAEAEFNLVPSRLAQKAILKAEKGGNTTVDLQALKDAEKAKRQQNSTGGDGVVTID